MKPRKRSDSTSWKAEGVSLRTKADALEDAVERAARRKTLVEDRQEHEGRVSSAEKALREAETKLEHVANAARGGDGEAGAA